MRRLAGQAARHGVRIAHALAQLALAALVLLSLTLAAVAWRLSRGPVDLPWLMPMLQAQLNDDAAAHVALGGLAVAWEGFHAGLDQPIDIRLRDVVLTDVDGRRILSVPRAMVTLSPGSLLRGRLVPRAVALEDVRLRLLRDAEGALRLDLPATPQAAEPPPDVQTLLRELAARPRTDRANGHDSPWSQLRRVRVDGARIAVTDRKLGLRWTIPALDLDLHRHAAGGIAGTAEATLAVGAVTARLAAEATLNTGGRQADLRLRLSPIDPAALARAVPQAAALAAVAAPVTLAGALRLGADLAPERFTLTATLGRGVLHVARGEMPVLAAEATIAGTTARMTLALHRFVTSPRPDGPRTTLTGTAEVTRGAGSIAASASLSLDSVAFADLPALWPEGLGGPDTRPWIVQNITDGTAHDFHVDVALTAPADLSDATITSLSGGGEGSDLTVHWLRPVPPITHGAARLTFLDPDSLEITASAGQEVLAPGAITVRGGRVLFTGLEAKDQFADITADLAGPVPAALALLGQKRINLLRRSPLKVQGAAGQFTGRVTVTDLPLRNDVNLDDLKISTALRLTGARLPGLAAGRDLDRGMLDITADGDGLHAGGQAQLAGIPAQLQADIDFRAGPPDQVVQSISVNAAPDSAQLATLGLDPRPFADGRAQMAAQLVLRRNGAGDATVTADLGDMALTVQALSWQKPRGRAAQAQVRLLLDHERIVGLNGTASGKDLSLAGSARFADGRPTVLRLDRLALGPGNDLHGTLRVPARPGDPWQGSVAGRSLDVSAMLRRTPEQAPARKQTTRGAPYAIEARVDQVVLGPGRIVSAVTARAESDGEILRRLDLTGRTAPAQPFRLQIAPVAGGRQLTGSAADAGALLRALDVIGTMQGGRLTLSGRYDDAVPDHRLTGRAEIADFRVRHAPALGKLLQAMTLYGLVDVLQGPGLGFSRLVAPFELASDTLILRDARAFSPSLGMTAKGRIDLARQDLDLQGTIVPAYFFNSLLGDLPIVGRMFSPERGGGVFAATYSVNGPMNDPRIAINPLAALTPGFLRGLFGLFDRDRQRP